MLLLTLQLLHFSSSFLTTINSYLYMLLLYRLCSTKQQKCNPFLKFQSNFSVDKGTYNYIEKFAFYAFLFTVIFLMQCVTILVSQSVFIHSSQFPLSIKLGPFPSCSLPWESQVLLHVVVLNSTFSDMAFLPDVNLTFSTNRHFCLAITHLHQIYHEDHISFTTLFFFHLPHLLHAFKWAIPPRTSAHSNLRHQNHLKFVF